MTAIPAVQVSRDGVALAAPITTDGTDVTLGGNDGNMLLQVTNPTGGTLHVTLKPTATVGGIAFAGSAEAVPAGATRWFGPIPPAVYNDDSGNVVVAADAGLQITALGI